MSKTKLILVVALLLAFAAGVSLGLFLSRPGQAAPAGRQSYLEAELKLSPEQRDQMRKIWSEAMSATSRQQQAERRSALAAQLDQKIAALIPASGQEQYRLAQQEYNRQMDQLSQERKRAFDEAVARTNKILTPEQAAKYGELMKRQREHGGGAFRGGHRHAATAASQPATLNTSSQPLPPQRGE
jgi:Spy/CpxP family protein refolding chaperone